LSFPLGSEKIRRRFLVRCAEDDLIIFLPTIVSFPGRYKRKID
jgi:hypothetical protein